MSSAQESSSSSSELSLDCSFTDLWLAVLSQSLASTTAVKLGATSTPIFHVNCYPFSRLLPQRQQRKHKRSSLRGLVPFSCKPGHQLSGRLSQLYWRDIHSGLHIIRHRFILHTKQRGRRRQHRGHLQLQLIRAMGLRPQIGVDSTVGGSSGSYHSIASVLRFCETVHGTHHLAFYYRCCAWNVSHRNPVLVTGQRNHRVRFYLPKFE